MTIKDQTPRLLRGREADRIRFVVTTSIGKITINRAVFETVALAIEGGKIGVRTVSTFDAGVGAQYSSDATAGASSGELEVPPICGCVQEGYVLHECIHAYFDLKKSTIRATEEEAVAFVVNALYFRMTGLAPARWNAEPHATAKAVADELLRRYQAGTPPTPEVGTKTWGALVLAVGLHDVYFTAPAGLPRWLPIPGLGTDTYAHNG